ncbi:efflux pump antibiotic resistance protein [Apiospora marii]|uniref:Efflux pump antibiotic resistance protein n=1 Tax=Apiospora marii TaxID=335849 RepID=A0ABR1RUF5_9PEZI
MTTPQGNPALEKGTEPRDLAADEARELASSDEGVGERKLKGIAWVVAVTALLSSTFLYALDNTVMANVRPSIVETFQRIDMLPWLSCSYPMGEVGANPLWGKLNKQFNNKTLYFAALCIFEVGSAVIGSAQSVEIVVVGRALAGFGGCGIYVGTMNIVSAITTPMERTHYLNLVGVSWCLGTILGPIIGGAFADSTATWRWAFYINLVIAAVATPACLLLIPSIVPPTSNTLRERLWRIDYIGATLFLGGVVTVIMILSFGGAFYPWQDGRMIALYVVTVAIWIIFAIQQRFSLLTVDRIFPIQFVANWEMVVLFCWTALAISNLVVTVYSLPLHFQFTYGSLSLTSGAYTIPFVGAVVVSIAIAGPLFAKAPFYMAWYFGASCLMLIGNNLLATLNYTTSFGAICGYSIIGGLGVGPVVQLGYTVAQVKVAPKSVPEATAFLSCAQMAGLAISLGMATSIFLNGATDDVARILPDWPRHRIMAAIDGANTDLFDSVDAETVLRVREVVSHKIGQVFYLNVAGAALGFVLSSVMKRERLVLTQ